MVSTMLLVGMLAVATPLGVEAADESVSSYYVVIAEAYHPPGAPVKEAIHVEWGVIDPHEARCAGHCLRRVWVEDAWGVYEWRCPYRVCIGAW